jgi:hypothetical protein
MKETALWNHLRPELARLGKFQKIADKFTLGIPDVLGIYKGRGVAVELKEFGGAHLLKVKFRPGQLRWLRDWQQSGGLSWVAATNGPYFYLMDPSHGELITSGVSVSILREISTYYTTGVSPWELAANAIVSK